MLPSVGGFAISFGSYFEMLMFDLMNLGIRLEIYKAIIIRMDRVHIRLLKKNVYSKYPVISKNIVWTLILL